MKTIGVDLGGSHVMAAVVDDGGAILEREDIDVESHASDDVLATIVKAVETVRERANEEVDALGLGSPGNVDPITGTVRYSPNFGWHDVPLGRLLHEKLGLTVSIGNDARCAALGEYLHGTGRGTQNFVLLTLGTGIGGGIVVDGALVLGSGSTAGEIGHHQIRATDGFHCHCGKRGCFEAQASGTGLIRHALAVASSFPRSTLVSGKPDKLGSKAIRKAAEAGDAHGVVAWSNYADDLARGLANVITFVNPETIALGGGVSSAGDYMLDALRPRLDELVTMTPREMRRDTKISIASLGNDAGAIGAAAMARQGGLVEAALALRRG